VDGETGTRMNEARQRQEWRKPSDLGRGDNGDEGVGGGR
jgi:hypothetical protein